MTAVLGAIAPAAVAAGAELVGTHYRNVSARQVAQEQMQFQREMSSTAYQRGVEDMKKAGINPILGHQHAAASAPSGASWDPQAAGQNVASALNLARLKSEIAQVKAQTNLTQQQAEKIRISNVGDFIRHLPWAGAKELFEGKTGLHRVKSKVEGLLMSSAKDYVRGFKRPWKSY